MLFQLFGKYEKQLIDRFKIDSLNICHQIDYLRNYPTDQPSSALDHQQISPNDILQVLSTLQDKYISEIVCLVSQLVITIHTAINLRNNREYFPVKQLSPLLSFVALLCFFLLNCISLIARIIQSQNAYFDPNFMGQKGHCGQCRLCNHPEMIVLGFLYNGLRQLPLIIFIVKTYRVCLCYNIKFDKQLSKNMISLFSNEKNMLILSSLITLTFMVAGFFVYGKGNPYYGKLAFQFFCPKQSSIYDWILTTLRFCAMAYVYTISMHTYNELDFKKFLILIFILTNTEVLLRLFLAIFNISQKTYHEFYYHSFILNLFGTLIMFYYSTIKEQKRKPLTIAILERFEAFLQTQLGESVLKNFAQYRNKEQKSKKYTQTFEAYILVELISIYSYRNSQNNYRIASPYIPTVLKILNNNEIIQDLQNRQLLMQKCESQEVSVFELRNLSRKLSDFCLKEIFYEWRQTESSKYLENEFKNNGIIDLRMSTLGIGL